jgi:hypothetical protein
MSQIINWEFLNKRPFSYSRGKEFRKSPKHYVYSFEKPFIESDAMLLGSAVDCLLIDGEDEFNKLFAPYSNFAKRSNDAKAEWQTMVNKARAEKKRLISNEMILTAHQCVKAIREYPDAQPYLRNIRKKHPRINWIDRETKVPCVGIPDWDCLLDGQLCIVDLKTSSDADPEQFTKDAWKWEYFIQVGSYLAAYKHAEFQFPMFVFIVVETTEPFNVSVNFVENKYIEFCKEEWQGTLRAFKYCLDNDLWNAGYEFRLMGTASYFALRKPGYGKALFGSWDND